MRKIKIDDLVMFRESDFEFFNDFDQDFDCTKAHERAFEAIQAGFEITSRDYNIFVVGDTGTGRRTFVKQTVQDVAKEKETASDWIYVYNFDDHWSPLAISLNPGDAKKVGKDVEKLLEETMKALDNLFESDLYQEKSQELKKEYDEKQKNLWDKISEQAKELNFILKAAPNGILTLPSKDGKQLTDEQLESMSEEEKNGFNANQIKCKQLVEGYLHKSRIISNDYQEESEKLNEESAEFTLNPLFMKMEKKYKKYDELVEYFKSVKQDLIDNLMIIMGEDQEAALKMFNDYQINVFVDNSRLNGAPTIFELNPTYSNLFGKIEYLSRNSYLYTDHTLIKAGSFHKANGGYIIIEAKDLLQDFYVWDTLKKMLYSERINVENIESRSGYSSLATIKPDSIPLNLKVILVGDTYMYDMLYELDPDFEKLFRIKAEFDFELENNEESKKIILSFIYSVIEEKKLAQIDRSGVMAVFSYLLRLSGSRKKLSSYFNKISDLLIEASRHALKTENKIINESIIKKTLLSKEKRVSLEREKIDEMILDKQIIINTTGEKIGEVNGLSVLNTGDYIFGVPARITCEYSIGNSGIVDIQREVDMSGKIFKKAVLTLESFFEARYAKDIPLSVKATVSFEQTYGEIEGDSATVAETISLISAISGIPVKQGIAITGSMSQKGEVQTVGGITEKVEGFYRICKQSGLTGEQGVIIPEGNYDSLILNDEIIESVKQKQFSIWTVETIEEAIEIIMDKKAGIKNKNGNFPRGSVNYHLMKKLSEVHKKILEEHDADGIKEKEDKIK
ncbi:MAG TPA: ATP-binding protein [Thermotogota bacterium]|nr:ATP-binding protein [Thermotogota bacterium]HPJ88718.1 ATP-binding protein [Thermotogota bacterium]